VRLWHVPNVRGNSEHNLLKNAKGRLYYFLVCPTLFFKVQVVYEDVHLSPGKSLFRKICSPFFEKQICPGPIATNVCVSAVVRFRSRVLSPKPNLERRYKLWANCVGSRNLQPFIFLFPVVKKIYHCLTLSIVNG